MSVLVVNTTLIVSVYVLTSFPILIDVSSVSIALKDSRVLVTVVAVTTVVQVVMDAVASQLSKLLWKSAAHDDALSRLPLVK